MHIGGQPSKKLKKSGAKGSVAFLKESFQLGCVAEDSHPIYSTERGKIGIKSHRQIRQGHVAPHKNSGKKRSIVRSDSKSVNFMSAIRALPDLRKEHQTKLCNKKDAPAE